MGLSNVMLIFVFNGFMLLTQIKYTTPVGYLFFTFRRSKYFFRTMLI